jgi:hypothetical protein
LTSAERGTLVTAETCMSAAGVYMPTMFVFPRVKENPLLLDEAPPGSFAQYHPSGWMQSHIFVFWFKRFIEFSRPSADKPVLLILDGHATHTKSLELIELARANNVVLLCLPPHCSHRMQPLDVTFMAPLSTYYQQEVRQWLAMHPGRPVTIYQVGKLYGNAFMKAALMQTAVNGFAQTGIYPQNRNVFPEHLFAPSLTTDRPAPLPRVEDISIEIQQQSSAPAQKDSTIREDSPTICILNPRPIQPLTQTSEPQPCCSKSLSSTPYQHLSPQTTFTVSPSDIMPFPQAERKIQQTTDKRKGRTVILTDSPYKNELESALMKKKVEDEEKKRKAKQMKIKVEKKTNKKEQKTMPNKRQLFADEETQKKEVKRSKKEKVLDWNESSDEEGDNAACVYCNALYTDSKGDEGWIQCTQCRGWAHDSCSGVDEEEDDFTCELCQSVNRENRLAKVNRAF